MKKVKVTIALQYADDDVACYSDGQIERMLETNFDVAEGVFDLGAGTSPAEVRVDIEAE